MNPLRALFHLTPYSWRPALRRWLRPAPHPDELELVRRALGSVTAGFMIDVGAHHGSALLQFAETGWQVLGFEPDPENRAVLEPRIRPFSRVTLDPRALGAQPGQATLYSSPQSTGISTLRPFHPSHREGWVVEVTTLAAVIAARSITHLDLLKIDVEGFDFAVLQGYPWERFAPRAVVCEFEDHKTLSQGHTADDLGRFLVDRGYRVIISEWWPIESYGGNHRWRRFAHFPAHSASGEGWGNFIAFKEAEPHARFIRLSRKWEWLE